MSKARIRALVGAASLLGLVTLGALLYDSVGGPGSADLTNVMLVNLLAVLGLQVFVGNSGVLSFAHVGVAGLAAYATALLCTSPGIKSSIVPDAVLGLDAVHLSPLAATLVGVAVATVLGSAVGLLVVRLAGMAAAIVTLAALIVINNVVSNAEALTGGAEGFFGIPRLDDKVVLLGCVGAGLVAARLFRESRTGRQLQAARDDELSAQAMGVRVGRARITAWILSLVLVSAAGALRGQVLGTVTPEEFYFELTFTTIAMLIVGGAASVTGALVGTVLLTGLQETARTVGDGTTIAGVEVPMITGLPVLVLGASLVLIMVFRPGGLLGRWELDDVLRRSAGKAAIPEPAAPPAAFGELDATDIAVSFENVKAVDGVSLRVERGEVVGLIGANGAGKTTLLNALSGLVPMTRGEVRLEGEALAGRAPWAISRAGVSRTFQNIRLFRGLTAAEHLEAAVAVRGRESRRLGSEALLAQAGIADVAAKLPDSLSYGDRRRLEIARALATDPAFLLLDEPAAGMNAGEAEALADRIRAIRDDRNCGIVLIDHDLPFVFDLCDRIYVMAAGRVIAEGVPEEVRVDPLVIASYLGEEDVASDSSLAWPRS